MVFLTGEQDKNDSQAVAYESGGLDKKIRCDEEQFIDSLCSLCLLLLIILDSGIKVIPQNAS